MPIFRFFRQSAVDQMETCVYCPTITDLSNLLIDYIKNDLNFVPHYWIVTILPFLSSGDLEVGTGWNLHTVTIKPPSNIKADARVVGYLSEPYQHCRNLSMILTDTMEKKYAPKTWKKQESHRQEH